MTTAGDHARRSDLLTVKALLDDALVGLRGIDDPEIPLQEARSYVSASLARVYEALAHATEARPFHEHSYAALQLARDALTALSFRPSLDPAVLDDLRLVAQAIGHLNGAVSPPEVPLRLPRGDERPPLRASIDEPVLHDPERTVLYPTIPLPDLESVSPPAVDADAPSIAPPPPVRTAEDLAALQAWGENLTAELDDDARPESALRPPRSARPDQEAIEATFGKAAAAPHVVWLRGRAFFEDIAMMSLMRQAGAGELWLNLEPVERRLLARVDALLACGPWIFPRLVQLLEERPVPDPELSWASLFVLGCVQGDDTRDQIERLLRTIDLDDPELFEAAADALAFAPHRGVEGIARRWLEAERPARVRLAVRVLGRRRATTVDTLRPLLRSPDPATLREVVAALELVPGELDPSELRAALAHGDVGLFRAAAECATARGLGAGVHEARSRLGEQRVSGAAALLAAIGSDERSLDLLLGAAATEPSADIYAALGWYGSIEAMPFLLGRLRDGDEAAVLGLQRLTGASLSDEDPELPEYAEDELPFARAKFVPPRFVAPLSTDAERWTAWWDRYGRKADARVRYRWGHRWSTRDDYHELAEAIAAPEDRRLAWLELCARTGGTLPFDAREFVSRQRAQVLAWRGHLGESHERVARGTWPVRFRR